MSDVFLQLSPTDRKAILVKAAESLGRSSKVLEKDVWVCWTLDTLTRVPKAPPVVFKGGTSLSKVYDAIARFSEDVDVTLDRQVFAPSLDPFVATSRNQQKKIVGQLDELVAKYVVDVIKPFFDDCLSRDLGSHAAETFVGNRPDQLVIPYPSALDASAYISESVLLELGGKNKITPSHRAEIVPYAAPSVPNLVWPTASVPTLDAERTFWEKATLIHAECNRVAPREDVSQMSRHWYDLARLARGPVGEKAIPDRELLADVVNQKSVLYHSGHANYDLCTTGGLKLLPSSELTRDLSRDFEAMRENAMFWEAPPTLSEILGSLEGLQNRVNQAAVKALGH